MKHEKFNSEDMFSAMKENRITAEMLTKELEIIFNDYFLCSCNAAENVMMVTFLNGQEFEIFIDAI